MEKKPPYISDKTEMYGGLVSERVISELSYHHRKMSVRIIFRPTKALHIRRDLPKIRRRQTEFREQSFCDPYPIPLSCCFLYEINFICRSDYTTYISLCLLTIYHHKQNIIRRHKLRTLFIVWLDFSADLRYHNII